MAKPRIFISSTYYDLRHVRASLETFVDALGYEPILSEKGDIAYAPDIPLDESCYQEAEAADILVLIIGGRYGAERSDSRTSASRSFFERYDSITKQEYKSAISNNVPVYILIDTQVYAEYQTYLKNKGNNDIVYAHVDSVNIFGLIEDILLQRLNNPMSTFSKYSDIEDWLREQWAGYFRDLLKRTTESRQLASLSSQVSELAELNKTLRTYLENVISIVNPQSQKLVEDETKRLDKVSIIASNGLARFLNRVYKLPFTSIVDLVEKPNNIQEFIKQLSGMLSETDSGEVLEIFDSPKVQMDLNEARKSLGKKEFVFETKVENEFPSGHKKRK
jgi:Domain of unknown function (DUF4062)